jgi:prepilin-type N-terminal cleavage/methylation domain-containing protein
MVKRHGFGLVEVIVALTLVGVALLGVAGSALTAAALLRQAEASEQGALQALQLIDSLALIQLPTSGAQQFDRFDISWLVRPDSTGLQHIDVEVAYGDGRALRHASFNAVLESR